MLKRPSVPGGQGVGVGVAVAFVFCPRRPKASLRRPKASPRREIAALQESGRLCFVCAGNFGLAGGENRNGGLGGKLRAIYRGKRGKRERGSSSHATSPTLARSAAAPSSAGLPSSGQASGQASGDSSHWYIPLPEGKQRTASMTASLGALVVSGVCM
jgi:hypothetical protein